ncbi:asparagine synthetase B family protein [Arenibacterium sp. CAU 1754]
MTLPAMDAWQYRLTTNPEPGAVAAAGYHLTVGPDMECVPVTDQTGQSVGWLIGFPIDLAGNRMIAAPHRFGFAYNNDPDRFAQAVITSLAGRFLWIADLGGIGRIYPDCSALVPCVFDAAAKRAGCSANSILSDAAYEDRFQHALSNALGVDKSGWFPGGLTAHRGVDRLLPNHYLDLQTWTAVRYWPTSDIPEASDPRESIQEIVQLVRQQYGILTSSEKKVAISLTGGRDTRMLLACARPFLDQASFVTVTGADGHSMDTVMARMIARGEGLHHMELPRQVASDQQRDHYLRLGGHCVADGNSWYYPSVAPLRAEHVLLGGAGGEVSRAFFWQPSDTPETAVSGATLTGRMGFRKEDEVVARLSDWMAAAPFENTLHNLDLAYVEQRMGPWGAAQFPCDPTLVRYAPLVTRRVIELMIGLPAEWKRNGRAAEETVRQAWPELETYRYNSLGPVRDTLLKIRRVASDPALVVKRLRKMSNR